MDKGTLKLVRCLECGMIYVRSLDESFADGSFYQSEAAPYYLSEEKLRGDYSPARYRREIRLLRRFVKAGAVLDVGCSTGGFLYQLDQRYRGQFELFGTDVPSEATKFAESKGVKIISGDFLNSPERLTYHAITFWAVLEHVSNPAAFLKQALKMLKPGGICIALVPNIESLAVKLLGARYRYILPQHLNYFSSGTLRRLAQNAGFEILSVRTMHFNPAVIWQDRRNDSGLVSDFDRAKLLAKTNSLKESKALLPLRLAYNLSERVLNFFGLADNVVIVGSKIAPNGR